MAGLKILATIAALSATPVQAQEQSELALPEHIAGAINCIISQGEQGSNIYFSFPFGEKSAVYVRLPSGRQFLTIHDGDIMHLDDQNPEKNTILDGISDSSTSYSEIPLMENYNMEKDLNEMLGHCYVG